MGWVLKQKQYINWVSVTRNNITVKSLRKKITLIYIKYIKNV